MPRVNPLGISHGGVATACSLVRCDINCGVKRHAVTSLGTTERGGGEDLAVLAEVDPMHLRAWAMSEEVCAVA